MENCEDLGRVKNCVHDGFRVFLFGLVCCVCSRDALYLRGIKRLMKTGEGGAEIEKERNQSGCLQSSIHLSLVISSHNKAQRVRILETPQEGHSLEVRNSFQTNQTTWRGRQGGRGALGGGKGREEDCGEEREREEERISEEEPNGTDQRSIQEETLLSKRQILFIGIFERMLSALTESKLARFFVQVAQNERSIEIQRQVVCENPDFEPSTAFSRIDRYALGSISSLDMTNFLADNGLYVSERQAYHTLRGWNTIRNGRISLSDFLDIVLPATRPGLASIAKERRPYSVLRHECLPYDLEFALARLMYKEIQAYSAIEDIRHDLSCRRDFNVLDAFEQIDRYRDGFITESSLRAFVSRNGNIITDDDILAIMRRLDHDEDGRLNYQEFNDALLCAETTLRPRSHGIWDSPVLRAVRPLTASPSRRLAYTSPKRAAPARVETSPIRSPPRSLNQSFHTPMRRSVAALNRSFEAEYYTPPRAARISPPRELSRSPLRYSDEFELVDAIKTQIDLDKDLERAKEELAMRSDFNTIDAFNLFDPLRKGAIDSTDLKDVYNLHGQYPDFDELTLLLKKYDTNMDRKWSYHEFVDAILPKKIDYASMVRARIPFNSDGRYSRLTLFSSETSYLFKNVLRTWIKSEAHSESMRQRLAKRPMRVIDAFDALDKTHRGYLTELEFRDLLDAHRFYATREELKLLVDRYDTNKDGRVSLGEFANEIEPKSPARF